MSAHYLVKLWESKLLQNMV